MFLGVDIGSSSTKAAVFDQDRRLRGLAIVNLGTGTNAHQDVVRDVLLQAGISEKDICYTVATGYGRLRYENADKQITEITCHAKGVSFLMEDIRTVIDIGGQDAKVIHLSKEGRVENFVMNDKCAAGTGRFLEVMARVLDCKLEELSLLAERSQKELSINNVCTVFAESEVISRLAAGEDTADVARGAHVAVAKRVAGLCSRIGCEPKVAMTGGVALNSNLVDALAKELGVAVDVVPHCQGVGAIGAALFACELG